jgi:hypothetical protein
MSLDFAEVCAHTGSGANFEVVHDEIKCVTVDVVSESGCVDMAADITLDES